MAQTLTGIIDLIRNDLGFHKTLDVDVITKTINRVQRRYETGNDTFPLPWFCLEVGATITTTADQRTVSLPDDFVAFAEDWPLTIVNTDGETKDLIRKPMYFLNRFKDKTGFPEAYEANYNTLYAYPLPDDAYTINITYYKRLDDLSGETTSPWFDLLEFLLVDEVVYILADNLRDSKLLANVTTRVRESRAEYVRKCEAQKHELKQYVMGSNNA